MENELEQTKRELSKRKKLIFTFVTFIMISSLSLVIGEFSVRLLKPQRYMYPRWKYSEKYGSVIYSNVTVVDELRGVWKFTYSINEEGYRGYLTPVSNRYDKKNIVILGDSYTFGIGVNDGEEYAAILNDQLDEYNVINLALGGYGLTQQIRIFYEYGQLFMPQIVILQFCNNDPEDNFFNRVTDIQDNRFIFKNTNNNVAWVKKYLSNSIIQKSELYNLIRDGLYELFRKRTIINAGINANPIKENIPDSITPKEKFYNSLLDLFARDLSQKGIKLLMIAVNGHLDFYPFIKKKVEELDRDEYLKYIEVIPWFENFSDYGSPEGHSWGKKAHGIIGTKLAGVIKDMIIQRK